MKIKGDCNQCRIIRFLNMSILKRCIWHIVMSQLHVTVMMMYNSTVRVVSFLDKAVVYLVCPEDGNLLGKAMQQACTDNGNLSNKAMQYALYTVNANLPNKAMQ